jgi:hypothetical protein
LLKCKTCYFESENLEEICYYDINGFPYSDFLEIERVAQNPDSLAHVLCNECSYTFDFSS